MKKKYPDKIEDIEEFYKKELGNISFIESEDTFNRIQNALPYEKSILSLKKYLKISICLNLLFILTSSFFAYQYFKANESKEKSESSKPEAAIIQNQNEIKGDSSLPAAQNFKTKTLPNLRATKKDNIDSVREDESVFILKPSLQKDTASAPKEEQVLKKETAPVKKEVMNTNIDFYKKHSTAKKDSVRKLFVPDK